MVEFALGAGAVVEHVRHDATAKDAIVLSTLTAAIAAHASFSSFNCHWGGGFVRHQPFLRYAGENAFAAVRGVSLLNGRQHADTTLTVDHAVPHGTSRELFRSVIDGEATGTFQGKIIVRQDAQKTDGQMASNALLLSDDATMNNKPELEIFADDVVCAHGATCGALNDDQLFYLMARGLPKAEAEALLIEAFCGEAIDEVKGEAVQDMLRAARCRMAGASFGGRSGDLDVQGRTSCVQFFMKAKRRVRSCKNPRGVSGARASPLWQAAESISIMRPRPKAGGGPQSHEDGL